MPNFDVTSQLTALAAVVSALAALAAAMSAKTQIASAFRSASRKEWIQVLREELSELIGLINESGARRTGGTLSVTTIDDFSRVITQKLTKVELLLNSNEEDHRQLVWLLREVLAGIWHPEKSIDADKSRELTDKILEVAKRIIKTEWEQAKLGK